MIQFNKITLYNFGSYHTAEIDLRERGFCLVSGQNNYVPDNSLSNGSGKSFIWSAISFAITGETINGIKTQLKNRDIDENLSYVTLDFQVDAHSYVITRYIAPKTDLKIIRDTVDVSGKGIRESEKKLGELLPDLTKDLIASTIIIGQGMPNKFSSFSPSGRKELLEKLTKTDFMIEDVRNRVIARQNELNSRVRELEDNILAANTTLNIETRTLTTLENNQKISIKPDFEGSIKKSEGLINSLEKDITSCDEAIKILEKEIELKNTAVIDKVTKKSAVSQQELEAYNQASNKLTAETTQITFKISATQKEITKLKSITDICPTCHQKIPNVSKPDTAEQEQELLNYKNRLIELKNLMTDTDEKHKCYLAEISKQYDADIASIDSELTKLKRDLSSQRDLKNDASHYLDIEKEKLTKLNYDKANWDKNQELLQQQIKQSKETIEKLSNRISENTTVKNSLAEHLAVTKKMDTLLKRDFRGDLLAGVIQGIDDRAKKFCEIVFGTRDLDVYLDGNALDITYHGKIFDNLSGGEKQRVDLILQFAIRDLLNYYLKNSSNILVLDEITDFLDKKSCAAVMQLVASELNTIESVFIISHHSEELEIPIDSELTVIKNKNGISEVY